MRHQYLPGMHFGTLRKKPRTAQQILADNIESIKQKSLHQLSDIFGHYIPTTLLKPESTGTMSRRRIFSKENTFWSFFSQILDTDGGCQEVVRKIQAYASAKSLPQPSSSTAGYCAARKHLSEECLVQAYQHTAQFSADIQSTERLNGRRVIVVDGTGISMPDTDENQAVWPQQANQKAGCGFPQATLCVCFNLTTGILLGYAIGNKKSHELPMLREQSDIFCENDIFLGDKGFCSYYDLSLMRDGHIDSVVTLARRKPVKATEALSILGDDDLVIEWPKPKWSKQSSYTRAAWHALPDTLKLRQIKVTVNQPGFRAQSFYIVTTLMKAEQYTAKSIAELYYKRWRVELNFRDIKTTMGMDILRCKSPPMIRKEILMTFIVYNCLRRLMYESTKPDAEKIFRLSFKGALQSVRQWLYGWDIQHVSTQEKQRLLIELKESIASSIIRLRQGRREPRVVKRRPKPHQLMTRPRHEMIETAHRGRCYAKAA